MQEVVQLGRPLVRLVGWFSEVITVMTMLLPENLESPILAAVHSGQYALLDDEMLVAAFLLVQSLKQEQGPKRPLLRVWWLTLFVGAKRWIKT